MSSEVNATILVVDDNPASLYTTGRFLRAAGFNVREATTGQQALDQAEEGPAAIILDVNLPDIDGFEVCKTLRRRDLTSRTPIIHLSATFVGTEDKVQGLEAGADGYLTHPVEPPVLVATLNAFLRARIAEENMRRSEERFRAIFDHSVNGIALINEDLVYVEVNPSLCRILGRERSEIIGASISVLAHLGNKTDKDRILGDLNFRGIWGGVFPLTRPDAADVVLDWHISLHKVPNLRLVEVTDITARVAAEKDREYLLSSERAARMEAERANHVKDEFLAMISHELRSPLNAIVGWAKHLKSGRSTNINDYFLGIDAIDRNASLQARLIADLLDVSSFITGTMRLDFGPTDIVEIVRGSVDSHMNMAKEKSITLEQSVDSASAIVWGDSGRLHQMMANLITNAIKFTPKGGHIQANSKLLSSHLEIVVSDTGNGITNEFLPHIFDTFRQEDSGTRRVSEGLGLGLAIVKRVVELHGGTISAFSDGKGKGATFVVSLPLYNVNEAEAYEIKQTAAIPPGILNAIPVLVVDDDVDTRSLLLRILNDYGAVVTEASSAQEALACIKVSVPRILISDIGMPGGDGYELIRQIRAGGYDSDQLPAIAITAFAREEDRKRTLASGYQVHMHKPLDPYQIIWAVSSLSKNAGEIPRISVKGS